MNIELFMDIINKDHKKKGKRKKKISQKGIGEIHLDGEDFFCIELNLLTKPSPVPVPVPGLDIDPRPSAYPRPDPCPYPFPFLCP